MTLPHIYIGLSTTTTTAAAATTTPTATFSDIAATNLFITTYFAHIFNLTKVRKSQSHFET